MAHTRRAMSENACRSHTPGLDGRVAHWEGSMHGPNGRARRTGPPFGVFTRFLFVSRHFVPIDSSSTLHGGVSEFNTLTSLTASRQPPIASTPASPPSFPFPLPTPRAQEPPTPGRHDGLWTAGPQVRNRCGPRIRARNRRFPAPRRGANSAGQAAAGQCGAARAAVELSGRAQPTPAAAAPQGRRGHGCARAAPRARDDDAGRGVGAGHRARGGGRRDRALPRPRYRQPSRKNQGGNSVFISGSSSESGGRSHAWQKSSHASNDVPAQ